ncbi:unnamed protein product [Durusdinium trenchii]|uniref:Uncharacterized protein n=1 Tax=Durusdinium trenchii TaxID=1381693 RepID=A0ABP0LUY1_9DINO
MSGPAIGLAEDWPPLDLARLGCSICFDEQQGITFEKCCDQETYGPWGNPECLSGVFSFEVTACEVAWSGRGGWSRRGDWVGWCYKAQENLYLYGPPEGQEEQANLMAQSEFIHEESCCLAYEAPENFCWNLVSGMNETIFDTKLSTGYVKCCFDHFQELVDAFQRGEPDPSWLQKELQAVMGRAPKNGRHETRAGGGRSRSRPGRGGTRCGTRGATRDPREDSVDLPALMAGGLDAEAAEACRQEFRRFAQQAAKVVDRKMAQPEIGKVRHHLEALLAEEEMQDAVLTGNTGGTLLQEGISIQSTLMVLSAACSDRTIEL